MPSDGHDTDAAPLPERALADTLDAQRVLANVSAGLFGTAASRPQVGRFTLLDQLGAGAMGTVYSAFDPELDRKIAIKILHGQSDESIERARARLLREARALAKLTHPNVATVYEIGTVGDRVFIAMEFVQGHPLDAWMETRHPWREVVQIFEAAGHGLSAAHDAGIVHRDFKPGNVMLADDGRVVVLDFGLAAPEAEATVDEHLAAEQSRSGPIERLTATKAVVGTPAYMSPEQHLGDPATAKSDQFALCVSVFEALYGARPFAGTTRAAVLSAIENGEVTVPGSADVPGWLHRAVVRGLAADPDARWPNVVALVDAMTRDPVAKWRRRLVPVGFVAVVLGTAYAVGGTSEADPCAEATAAVDSVWNSGRRDRTAAAIEASGFASAPYAGPRLLDGMDAYANALSEAYSSACHDQHADPPVPGVPERRRCLETRLRTLEATADLLAAPSERLLDQALRLVPSADELSVCERAGLEQGPELAVDTEARRRIEAEIARAKVLLDVGDKNGGRKVAEDALELALTAGDDGLRARARIRLARAHMVDGRYADSEPLLHQALLDAERSNDAEAKTTALRQLSRVLVKGSKHEQAQRMAELAEAAQSRFQARPRLWDAELEEVYGDLAIAREDWDEAIVRFKRMNAIVAQSEVTTMTTLSAMSGLAEAYHAGGDYELAVALWRELEGMTRDAYGPNHRGVAVALSNRASAHFRLGDRSEAVDAWNEALAIRENADGPGHPSHAGLLTNMAAAQVLSDPAAAIPTLEKARRLYANVSGERSANAALVSTNLGITHEKLGHIEDSRAAFEQAIEIRTELGLEGAKLGRPLVRLAEVEVQAGRCERALEHVERAEPELAPDNSAAMRSIVRLHLVRARCAATPSVAVEHSERANAYADDKGLYGTITLLARLDLADRIVTSDRARAVALIRSAVERVTDEGVSPELLRKAKTFLATHAEPAGP